LDCNPTRANSHLTRQVYIAADAVECQLGGKFAVVHRATALTALRLFSDNAFPRGEMAAPPGERDRANQLITEKANIFKFLVEDRYNYTLPILMKAAAEGIQMYQIDAGPVELRRLRDLKI
jgi:hypothetical protein